MQQDFRRDSRPVKLVVAQKLHASILLGICQFKISRYHVIAVDISTAKREFRRRSRSGETQFSPADVA
jgi:hypothetical protein